jgi:hypothetical protein
MEAPIAINGLNIPPIVSPTFPVSEKSILNQLLVVSKYGKKRKKMINRRNGMNIH